MPLSACNQQIIGLATRIRPVRAKAGNGAIDQAGPFRAQVIDAQPQTPGGALRQVLHEHVRLRHKTAHQGHVIGIAQIQRDAFLALIEPREIGRHAIGRLVVAACEITLWPLNLDHPRPGLGQTGGAERGGDGLFQRDDQYAIKRFRHGSVASHRL